MEAGWTPVITTARYGDFVDGEPVGRFTSRETAHAQLIAVGVARPARHGDHPDAVTNGELVLCDEYTPAGPVPAGSFAHRSLAATLAGLVAV